MLALCYFLFAASSFFLIYFPWGYIWKWFCFICTDDKYGKLQLLSEAGGKKNSQKKQLKRFKSSSGIIIIKNTQVNDLLSELKHAAKGHPWHSNEGALIERDLQNNWHQTLACIWNWTIQLLNWIYYISLCLCSLRNSKKDLVGTHEEIFILSLPQYTFSAAHKLWYWAGMNNTSTVTHAAKWKAEHSLLTVQYLTVLLLWSSPYRLQWGSSVNWFPQRGQAPSSGSAGTSEVSCDD